jgi:hypothetical protein
MFPSQENQRIYKLYESPDNIRVGEKRYNYDDRSLGNYTCIIDAYGHFVMTNKVQGHGELRRLVRASTDLSDMVKSNTGSDSATRELAGQTNEIRIWPKFEIVSMWNLYGLGDYLPAIFAAITAAGGNPETYMYDKYDSDGYVSYDEIVAEESTDEDRKKQADATAQKARDQKELGDYMARSRDKDFGLNTGEPSFYNQKKLPRF